MLVYEYVVSLVVRGQFVTAAEQLLMVRVSVYSKVLVDEIGVGMTTYVLVVG